MARVNAQEYAEKWGRRLKASTEDIRRGIDRTTEAPGVAAAKAAPLMLAKVTESVNNGTWASQVGKVSLQDWQKAAKEKGITRIASGVDAAAPKQAQMAGDLLAAVDAAAAKANAIPKGDIEASINRMTTFVREMNARKLRRPGGR
jgi:hypothetical protein